MIMAKVKERKSSLDKNNMKFENTHEIVESLTQFSGNLLKKSIDDIHKTLYEYILSLKITNKIAFFHSQDDRNPFLGDVKYSWNILKPGELPYKSGKKHCISFSINKSILHLEKQGAFKEHEISLLQLIKNIAQLCLGTFPQEEQQEKDTLLDRTHLKFDYSDIIGESKAILKTLSLLDKTVMADVPVLIIGESGTGKELIAQYIHKYSCRSTCPFVKENCAAIPESLQESELFGYKKGSFTGAYQDKKGLFELADKGVIFLDEIGDMSLSMQKKLLRTLQEGEIRAIGAKRIKKIDVRVIAATNKNLKDEAEKGNFRQDLYYRLNVITICLPPLREREEDIVLLFEHFVKETAKNMGIKIPSIDKTVKQCLENYRWPGNIREMQNEVKRIMALLDGEIILPDSLSFHIQKVKEFKE